MTTLTDRDPRDWPENIERKRLWRGQENKPLDSPERDAFFDYTNGPWEESKRKRQEGE